MGYDSGFYNAQVEGSLRSARIICEVLKVFIQPRTVIDVGCGVGPWLKAAKENLGATTLVGVEGTWIAANQLLDTDIQLISLDLAEQKLVVNEKFDLCLSVEVAEYLPQERSESFVADLAALSDIVLFSAAIPGQGGIEHLAERPAAYWAGEFAKHNFRALDVVRPRVWNNDQVDWWYAQNIILYCREGVHASNIGGMESGGSWGACDLVHPKNFSEKVQRLRGVSQRKQELQSLSEIPTVHYTCQTIWRCVKSQLKQSIAGISRISGC